MPGVALAVRWVDVGAGNPDMTADTHWHRCLGYRADMCPDWAAGNCPGNCHDMGLGKHPDEAVLGTCPEVEVVSFVGEPERLRWPMAGWMLPV